MSDPKAARALERPELLQVVHFLLNREATASDVAVSLNLTLNAAYLKLRTLHDVGLIRVSREERRAGRAAKHYTAVAPRLFVPFDATNAADVEELYLRDHAEEARLLVRALLNAYRRAWGQSASLGRSHYRNDRGDALSTFGPRPGETWSSLDDDRPATLFNTGEVWLTPEEAKALQRELYTLHSRFAEERDGRRAYRLTLAMAPEPEDRTSKFKRLGTRASPDHLVDAAHRNDDP